MMNELRNREGYAGDRQVIDLMLAQVQKEKSEGAYNRAAYMPRRRERAHVWADMLVATLPSPVALVEHPSKAASDHSRRRVPEPVGKDFRFPSRAEAA